MSETIASSTPVADPTAEELEEKLRKIQVVDISDAVSANAIDAAERHINQETTQHGVRGFIKRILVGNIGRDFVRQRHIQRNREQIVEEGNIYALEEDGSTEAHNTAVASTVTRFTDEYIHEGEQNQSFEDTERGSQLLGDIRNLVREFAEGRLDFDALEEEKNRLLSEYGEHLHDQDRNRGLMFADNILEVAQYAKLAREHGLALDRIDQVLAGNIGEAQMGVRTEARLSATDRALDRLHHMTGGVLNEGTVGLAVAAAITIGKFTSRSALSAALRPLTMGASAGIWAGLREHLRVGQERSAHSREMAEGGTIAETDNGNSRREQMETTRYETVPAAQLIAQLEGISALIESGNIQAATAAITEAQMRIQMGDQRSIDLISYSSKTSVEEERLSLDFRLAEAKVLLGRQLTSMDDTELAGAGLTTRDVNEVISTHQSEIAEMLADDMDEKDAAFRKLRRNRTLKMAAIAGVGGILLGLGVQEIKALATDGLRGIFENSGGNRDSLLAAFANRLGFGGQSHDLHREFFEGGHHMHDVAVDLSHGYHLQPGNPGEKLGWSILGPDGHPVVKHLEWDTQGNLSHHTRELLHEKGLDLVQHHLNFREPTVVGHDVMRTPHEYLSHHPGEFVRAHRQLWYDNDTPGVFDHNELKLDWGSGGIGIDEHGDYVLNVGHMTPDGSWHEGLSTNAQSLVHEGKMALALSMSKDTQQFVHMVSIDQNGNAIIPHNSYLAHSLFENQDGHAKFIGGYAEAVQMMGKTPDGGESMRMLATVVGENHPNNATDVAHHIVMRAHEHYVTAIETNNPVEIPPVVPIYSRRGLEAVTPGVRTSIDRPYGYHEYPGREAEWAADRSPRLAESPDSDLDTGEELSWYRSRMAEKRGSGYVEDIDKTIDSEPVLKSMDKDVEALVCIPVAAANESENIYKALSLYAKQSKEDKKKTAIILNVNWMESLESNPDNVAKIQKTLSEIERAKKDFPELKIASFQKKWSEEFVRKRNGKIYGEVIKVLYDTAAMSVERAIREGRRSSSDEAMIITNDADAQGISNNYLERYIDNMEQNPTADIFTGAIRWGTKEYSEFPGYGVANGLYAVMNMMTQRRGNRGRVPVHTIGPNSAFRLSSYAAVGGCEDRDDMGAGADSVLGYRIMGARRLATSSSGSSGYGDVGAGAEAKARGPRKVASFVASAQVDTAADRLLSAYRKDKWLGEGWSGFNDGGYQDRAASASSASLERENPAADIDSIAKRLETNVEGFASYWYRDQAVVASSLALYLGTVDKEGRPLYRSYWGVDGKYHFRFTEEGKKHLQNRLMRDTRGRYDGYGSRIRRKLYGVVKPDARRRPVAEARLVGHTI
jgi:hypothetical protein